MAAGKSSARWGSQNELQPGWLKRKFERLNEREVVRPCNSPSSGSGPGRSSYRPGDGADGDAMGIASGVTADVHPHALKCALLSCGRDVAALMCLTFAIQPTRYASCFPPSARLQPSLGTGLA